MAVTKRISDKELDYGRVLVNFAYANTRDEAIKVLTDSIRKLDELPINIKLERSSKYSIESDQSMIRTILEELSGGKSLDDISDIDNFTFCYFAHFAALAETHEDCLIAAPPHFDNKSIAYTALVAFCLIGLLKSDSNRVRKSILKCKLCGQIYITKKVYIDKKEDKKRMYCPICSPKNKMTPEERSIYETNYKPIRKKREQNKKRNKIIREIMEKQGCSEKEAREYYEADKEISTEQKLIN